MKRGSFINHLPSNSITNKENSMKASTKLPDIFGINCVCICYDIHYRAREGSDLR